MEKKTALTASPAFESFIRERDHALERILFKYQIAIAKIVSVLKVRTEEIVAHISTKQHGKEFAKVNRDSFQKRLEPWFQMGVHQAVGLMKQMRASVYVLSYAGQAEAIGRALDKNTRANLSRSDVDQEKGREGVRGGNPHARIELSFHRLLRDVLDAFQLSQVLESPQDETIARILRAFPPAKKISKRPKMAKVREADYKLGEDVTMSSGVIDPETWKQMLEDYADEYLPFGRAPEDKIFYAMDYASDMEKDYIDGYQWEAEQELMNDFVQSVRNGEVEAAQDNGIDDFEWIAIIDRATDECCSSRDGLSSSEIQAKLDDGEDMGDCDSVVPPGHMGCRCRTAPMTTEMVQTEKSSTDLATFDSWLEDAGE